MKFFDGKKFFPQFLIIQNVKTTKDCFLTKGLSTKTNWRETFID
jgi:hypothetical protein